MSALVVEQPKLTVMASSEALEATGLVIQEFDLWSSRADSVFDGTICYCRIEPLADRAV